MNIITHNKVYSFFPRATFEDRRSLKDIPRDFKPTTLKPLAKCKARGWKIVDQITRDDFDGPNAVFSHGPARGRRGVLDDAYSPRYQPSGWVH